MTKELKLKILYRVLWDLANAEVGEVFFLCVMLRNVCYGYSIIDNPFGSPEKVVDTYFPELNGYKPEDAKIAWWPQDDWGLRERIRVINDMISKLEKQ